MLSIMKNEVKYRPSSLPCHGAWLWDRLFQLLLTHRRADSHIHKDKQRDRSTDAVQDTSIPKRPSVRTMARAPEGVMKLYECIKTYFTSLRRWAGTLTLNLTFGIVQEPSWESGGNCSLCWRLRCEHNENIQRWQVQYNWTQFLTQHRTKAFAAFHRTMCLASFVEGEQRDNKEEEGKGIEKWRRSKKEEHHSENEDDMPLRPYWPAVRYWNPSDTVKDPAKALGLHNFPL